MLRTGQHSDASDCKWHATFVLLMWWKTLTTCVCDNEMPQPSPPPVPAYCDSGGTGIVTFDVATNPGDTTREGSIQVGDLTFTVRQTGATCGYSLNAYGALFDKTGGNGSVLGSPSALGCTLTTGTTQPNFITLLSVTEPVPNPCNAIKVFGGVDFFPDGRAEICAFHGDVWIVSGFDDKLEQL